LSGESGARKNSYAAAFTGIPIVTNASGSDTVTKPDYITVIEARDKIYLPLTLRAAP